MTQVALNTVPEVQPSEPPRAALASVEKPVSRWRLELSLGSFVSALLLCGYAYAFYTGISQYWFHPAWTTDDALQQSYPFHEVQHPGLFSGDLITDVMKGYLAPAHYWLSYLVTMVTHDPIMTGHWVMLVQVVATVLFLFGAVRAVSASVPALLAVTWLLHSRNLMQRLTGGLPRGWSAPIFAAFFYFAFKGNHRGVLLTILLGCLLNPPATLVVAAAYGSVLVWRVLSTAGEVRAAHRAKLASFALLAPFFALVTLAVVHRPAHIGQMVSYSEAEKMVEFSRPNGRFPFVPFNSASSEIRVVGLEAFVGRFHTPPQMLKRALPYVVVGALFVLAGIGFARRRAALPAEVVLFGCSALLVYFLSRQFAFRLYVPNRHLQIPMAMFFIVAFSVGIWRAFHRGACLTDAREGTLKDTRLAWSWPGLIALTCLAGLIYAGSGKGLSGTLNFNYPADKKGRVFDWIKSNTPQEALIAGHPTHVDGVQLFGVRRAYVTTETTHPFYTRYYAEMKRRNEVVLRAHYSASLEELVAILDPEGIDYFVFKRGDFYPDVLPTLTFFPPFEGLMKELTSRPADRYAYRALPDAVDLQKAPFMPFKDRLSAVIDVKALKVFIQEKRIAARAARQLALTRRNTKGNRVAG